MRKTLVNGFKKFLLITIPMMLLCTCSMEIAFRLAVPVSNKPILYYDEQHEILKMRPNQDGHFIRGAWGDDFNARYHINTSGWNSVHEKYTPEKEEAITRIAVIGDSFVEGFQVDVDKNITAILEQTLQEDGQQVEVYNFGISGAPLSHYLHMMRYVDETYHPDIFVVLLIDNDYFQSFYSDYPEPFYLLFDSDESGAITERPIQPAALPAWRRLLVSPALVRYVRLNLNYPTPSRLIDDMKDSLSSSESPAETGSNSATTSTNASIPESLIGPFSPEEEFRLHVLLNYVFTEMSSISNRILLIADGPRYHFNYGLTWEEVQTVHVYQYNILAEELALEYNMPFLDLTPLFFEDFQQTGEILGFRTDQHWNARAHDIAGHATVEKLQELNWLP